MKGMLKFWREESPQMDGRSPDLQQQFQLERLEVNLFRGQSRDTGSPQVFGGQVLGQALMAAHATIEDGRVVHSLHGYFLRRGDFTKPIVYSVDRSRDGGSFSARRVVVVVPFRAWRRHRPARTARRSAGIRWRRPPPRGAGDVE